MYVSKSLGNWFEIAVFLFFLVSSAYSQTVTESREGFETNDFSRFPWESSGDAIWRTTQQERHSGSYCVESGSIEDGESTVLQVTLNCVSGDISFYGKVSSESGYDYLTFYIDGSEKGNWSGEEDWSEESFFVTTGTRTFKWIYSKDGSVSQGDDAAWIDDIVFPLESTPDQGDSLPLAASVEITTWQGDKRGACSFTFDDNLNTQFSHFIPKFRDLVFVGTVFLVTSDSWFSRIYDAHSEYAELLNSGWEIGSHTMSHPNLTELNDSDLVRELANSRAYLEASFNLPPWLTLAYPFSATDTRVKNMVAQYYIAARGGLGRTISSDMSRWSLEGYDEFNLPSYAWTGSGHNLSAMNDATKRAISQGEWIVEMIHGTNGDGWEPPDWTSVYEPHFDYVASRRTELWIDTFGNVYRYIAERNTCTVSVQPVTGGTAIVLSSKSTLPPTPVPLTIKIDIPDHWVSVTITDNGNVLSGRIITENQNKYYLVDIIPTEAAKELPVSGNTKLIEIPFNCGVNLTSWFHFIPNVQQIQFTKFTKQDFINIKSLGCDVIRLPIDLRLMTNDEPDYTIDPLFYYYLDQVIDWAEDLGLHLILDNHTGGVGVPTDPDIDNFLVPVWTQMAQRYKDRSNLIYYEVLNEPHDISDAMWNGIQQKVVDAIRRVDRTHTIIVGPAGWNSYHNLKDMPVYSDDNLIYTFHFYDPMLFTHQGAFWGNPPTLESLAGVPFPYDAARMPVCPAELEGTYWEDRILNYHNEGTVEYVKELIDIAADFQATRNVPLFCGEFGALMNNSYNEDRVRWHRVVRNYLEEKGIAWTIWEYTGGLGLFEPGSQELFNYDLNIPLVEALGFAIPPQQGYTLMPDVTEFDLYTDYIAPRVVNSSWFTEGILDFFSENNPVSGDFCIHWTGVNQYQSISFRFTPIKDLSVLVDDGFAIDFWVRCNKPSAKIDIRFVDTKTDESSDHPWRMRYTIDRNIAVWNGQWNHLQIPLNAFTEMGAWDDGWYNPIGAFDWKAVDCFDIVPEYGDLKGIHFYFDDIRVVAPN